jgi:hypothetical protein
MVGYIHCQFQPSPDSKFVKCSAQMILDYLFAGADDLADFTIGKTLPDQKRNLIFPRVEALTKCRDNISVFVSIASQLHTFRSLTDSRSQKHHTQVLFYSPQTYI